ncbi:MAG: DUF5131 family protein, partial [Actinophytocola sp.]|uniref:DUF5131 family protein n=1 Tax=Actinophytocola sp. TaxID=1872138 RepID=UPI001327211A
ARMRALLERWARAGWSWRRHDKMWSGPLAGPLPNVWLGVSVESQQWANIRIPALWDTPAAVRFVSCEPLLGPVDLSTWLGTERGCPGADLPAGGRGHDFDCAAPCPVDWVVVGGESGHGARPMHPDWARHLRDQSVVARVPFLFKQWGAWAPSGRGIGMAQHSVGREVLVGPLLDDMGQRQVMRRVGKGAAGRVLDGRTWDEFPGGVVVGGAR